MFNRGSEWRKWDLHVHTPDSIIQHYSAKESNDVWEDFIKDIESLPQEIKVLGINDYIFLDGYKKVIEYKKQGRIKNIDLILPVIELRLAKFCGHKQLKKINYHIIFSNEIEADVIEHQFINALSSKYKLDPSSKQNAWGGVINKANLEALGKKIKKSVPTEKLKDYGSDLEEGFNNLNIEYSEIRNILERASDFFYGKYLTAIGKTEWDAFNWSEGSIAEKKDIINSVNIVFTAAESVDIFYAGKNKLMENQVNSLLLDCSDAHFNSWKKEIKDRLGNCNTWIKADTTFEGLKQIIYEPEERVKIQEQNPNFDFEKSPFTSIEINDNVKIFKEENIFFNKNTIPLNNGLVSIIGGRGTGKSILIDYISSGLGKESKKEKEYTKSDKMTICRQVSLKEKPKFYLISDKPNIPFMYIHQSEIKDIVLNSEKFTDNIRKTIGVSYNYSVSPDYLHKAEQYINDYFSVVNILDADETNSQQKKESLDQEIKQNEDFISNITSQENKTKLETYKQKIEELKEEESFQKQLQEQRDEIIKFKNMYNEQIRVLNEKLTKYDSNLIITNIDVDKTIKDISDSILPKIEDSIEKKRRIIENTKMEFKDFPGDLSTLLNNVGLYQNNVIELRNKKKNLEENEKKFKNIKDTYFKELASDIKNSVNKYKEDIEKSWEKFKNGDSSYLPKQKDLLFSILGKDYIDVKVNICFKTEQMYELIRGELDGRSWSVEKLRDTLGIESVENYFTFIEQNLFNENIKPIRNKLLDILFKKYTNFLIHEIKVTSKGKDILKLSHGQQGTIYLRLKLAANLFSETIIYDQPEDDLDNEFIMTDLVSIFREIKKYRQVIIVSHNSNLVVNADSEQIIVANNENGFLKYIYGALENPIINEQICKILEGGKEAFQKREQKYGLD